MGRGPQPLQQDDKIKISERGSERLSFGHDPACEITAAARHRGWKPRPGIVQGLERVYIVPRRRHLGHKELRVRYEMIHDHFAACLVMVGWPSSVITYDPVEMGVLGKYVHPMQPINA